MNGVGRHLRILFRARRRALRNRFDSDETVGAGAVLVAVAVGAAVILLLGEIAAPALLEPPKEVAAGSAVGPPETLPPGTSALEAAFWLTVVTSAVTSFRVMEILYRRSDIRAVETYPLRLPALYVDRLAAVLVEAVGAGLAISLFFVPLCWHGAPRVAGLSALVALAGSMASTSVSFGLQLYAGALNARGAAEGNTSETGGAYGGPGQIFMFSPGIALAASAILILLTRLAVGELLVSTGAVRGFWVGFGITAAASVAALAEGFRHFVRAFPTISARFREADAVTYRAQVDYQHSDFSSPRLVERLLPDEARAPYRVLALQYGRGHALVRYSYAIFWILGGLALAQWSRTAFPPWAVALFPTILIATAANPWYRLLERPLRPAFAETLPVAPSSEALAGLGLALREILLLAGPYAAIVLWIDWSDGAAVALLRASAALLAPMGINGVMAAIWSLSEPKSWAAALTPVAIAVGLLALAILSLPLAVVAAVAGIAGHVVPLVRGAPSRGPKGG